MPKVFMKPITERKAVRKYFGEFPLNFDFPFNSYPNVDIIDNESFLHLLVELPGVQKEDVKIVLEDGIITLSGEKKNNYVNDEKANIIRTERAFGKFERKFQLPEDINPDEVSARFENGVLKISVLKLEPVKPKERVIEVK